MKSAFIQTYEKAEHSTHAQESSAEEYASNWIESGADLPIRVGTLGGEPYWSGYGFNSRVEWCA